MTAETWVVAAGFASLGAALGYVFGATPGADRLEAMYRRGYAAGQHDESARASIKAYDEGYRAGLAFGHRFDVARENVRKAALAQAYRQGREDAVHDARLVNGKDAP